jgi:hypothetical protein
MIKNGRANSMIVSWLLILVCMNLFSCFNAADKSRNSTDKTDINSLGYDLSKPERTVLLPLILHEVSGIALLDSTNVACVQDENGIVFIFDLQKDEIDGEIIFHSGGDYEGITRVDSTIYVLRSDGVLFRILNYESSGKLENIYTVGIPPSDYEGLCYDQKNHRLLIAPKSNPDRDTESENKHPIYAIDLPSGIFLGEKVLDLDISAINKYAAENKVIVAGIDSPVRFRPSAIGVHPVTNKLYVLSGVEQLLFVFDMDGTVEYIEKLNPEILGMAEGISFFANGDMLISNEGRVNPPSILIFNYMRK